MKSLPAVKRVTALLVDKILRRTDAGLFKESKIAESIKQPNGFVLRRTDFFRHLRDIRALFNRLNHLKRRFLFVCEYWIAAQFLKFCRELRVVRLQLLILRNKLRIRLNEIIISLPKERVLIKEILVLLTKIFRL